MNTVMTVMGPVKYDALGTIMPHEHLIGMIVYPNTGLARELDDVDIAMSEMEAYRNAGGNSLVEVTPRGLGRDVRKLQEIAKASDVKIIASTGFYTEPTYPEEVRRLTIPRLAELMIGELTEGIDGTDIKAGIIGEIGTGRGHVSPTEERVFRAAARAQRQTGVAISTHTYWGGELAHDQIDILVDEEVPTDRIIVGHLGDKRTPDLFEEIASRGVFIQFDHIGNNDLLPDRDRAVLVKQMLDRGYEDQLLLSAGVAYREQLHYLGGKGYDHVLTKFVPELRDLGVTEEQIEKLLIYNPRRALAGVSDPVH